ncbi:hypothetical protein GIB67_017821 [Kingdonia uniflora]|uniref:Phytocyanin domain-containing protein n=1 Tax=Kingdonia uniflora TaxID=39325 RepID=A0A7J7MP10_9MAGN|nr:hypothetical protein GIB67_017821 [Kingdonia uniflora]
MAGRIDAAIGCMFLLSVAILLQTSLAQTTHVVGGSIGWTVSADSAVVYTNWSSNQTFLVGDTLVFNFVTGTHDVGEVSKAAYDSCNGTTFIGSLITTGPASIVIKTAGVHYYICTFGMHCSYGQHLMINVKSTATPPTATPPASPPVATPPTTIVAPISPPTTSPPPSPTVSPPSPSTTASPPPLTSDSPSSLPPPPPKSASSVSVAGFSATVFSIIVAFLF